MTVRNLIYTSVAILPDSVQEAFYGVRDDAGRLISSILPEELLYFADKIIYIFETVLPQLILLASGISAGLALGLPLEAILPWAIPGILFTFYEMINLSVYPWDYLDNLNAKYRRDPKQITIANTELLTDTRIILGLKIRNNCLIIGPAGSGKTTAVHSLVESIESPSCPEDFKGKEIVQLKFDQLRSSSHAQGVFETRFLQILATLISHKNQYILFIDEAHRLTENQGQLGNMLKPFLEMGLHCIAATTDVEYQKKFSEDIALDRRFNPVRLDPPADNTCLKILKQHYPSLSDETLTTSITQARTVMHHYALPDSALKLIERVLPYAPKNTELTAKLFTQIVDDHIKKHFS